MKILFLTTADYSFWSHRLTLARAAQNEGADVLIMAPPGEYSSRLEKAGFRVLPWSISRSSLNPLREVYSFLQIVRAYRLEQPDLVHHIALKPIIYGGLAARILGRIPAMHTVTGLGHIFVSSSRPMLVLRRLLLSVLAWIFSPPNCKVVVQNNDDRDFIVREKIALEEKLIVVAGFGVDVETFVPRPEPSDIPVVMLPSRMLWEKGVREFVEAAKQLREQGALVRMVLVGAPDPNNPGCIPEEQLRVWADAGSLEWWGHQDNNNMPSVLCQSHVVCLPSYREGLPKVLLEAAACGRAIVTTNAPGCSSVVRHGENGLLVPIKNSKALASAIVSVLESRERRTQMGVAGRARAVSEFSDKRIARQTLAVYQELLNGKWHSGPVHSKRKAQVLTQV
ncbi:MAG: glycosyltransferase family 4 protein [Candidatus Acidiferrales bacterium]